MKIVEWTDGRGYNHRAVLPDTGTVEQAKLGMGMPLDPPDVERIDWEAVKRDLHNRLVTRGIKNWDDLRTGNKFFASVLVKSLKRHVVTMFREAVQ